MATVRITNPVAVMHPVSGQFVVLKRGDEYPDADIVTASFPWAFVEPDEPAVVTEVRIEQATAAPGEKRRTSRR